MYTTGSLTAGGAGIEAYTINSSTGALSLVSGSPFVITNGGTGAVMSVSPSNAYLAVGASSNYVQIYSINPTTGALSTMLSPWSIGNATTSIAFDSNGQFLFMSAGTTTEVQSFNGQTGTLTSTSQYTNGVNPSGVATVSFP